MNLINSDHSQTVQSGAGESLILGAFKHYELRSRLSVTASTQVYEAWDTQLHRVVAIKQISQIDPSVNSVEAQELILNEARKVAALSHSAFVKIHALEDERDSLFIVMEFVTGTSLQAWIAEHHGKERLVLGHILQLAGAMQEAHASGLIHGDIKPSNLIVDSSGKVRILNFGLSSHQEKARSDTPDFMDPHNSIPYMAPEQFANAVATTAGDVFALGTLWYEMLNGVLPHAGLQGLALVAAQVQTSSAQWVWSKSIVESQKQLILGMTARDVEKRFNSAQVLAEIKLLTASEPFSNSSTSLDLTALHEQITKQRQQKRRNVVLAGVLLVGLCGIGVWQLKPFWPQIVKAIKPYSESREMEQGVTFLTQSLVSG